jgi:hypothetical protein
MRRRQQKRRRRSREEEGRRLAGSQRLAFLLDKSKVNQAENWGVEKVQT